MDKHYCKECDENVDLEMKTATLKGELKGEEITYVGKVLYGIECHHEIVDEEILNINEKVLNDTYRKHNNILSIDEIRSLPEMYGIGKRPLSLILGWGELTFTRYFNGDIPTNTYANILLEINKSPEMYLKTLEMRKDLISDISYKKSRNKTLEMIKLGNNSSQIFTYIFKECGDITEKSICKLAYYIDGFHFAFYGENIINEETELIDNQPFYKDVTIGTLNFSENVNISMTQKLIADNVIKYLGCYSGKVLNEFIACEPPIINAIIKETKTINKQEICEYFESVIKKYKMLSPLDIRVFAEEKLK